MWRLFEDGVTIGKKGSKDGIILRDEEHDAGARITLERGCSRGAPYAVTCGIYGWFFHTRLLGSEKEADYAAMREGLAAILDIIPRVGEPEAIAKMVAVGEAVQAYVSRFP
jgi:hypothetical protein